jgi:Universal stress protein family
MKRILIATDGSPASQGAVGFGVAVAAEHDAAVVFVHVVPRLDRVPMSGFAMVGARPHELSEYDREPLEEAEAVAELHGVRARSKVLIGDTVDEIVAYADNIERAARRQATSQGQRNAVHVAFLPRHDPMAEVRDHRAAQARHRRLGPDRPTRGVSAAHHIQWTGVPRG